MFLVVTLFTTFFIFIAAIVYLVQHSDPVVAVVTLIAVPILAYRDWKERENNPSEPRQPRGRPKFPH